MASTMFIMTEPVTEAGKPQSMARFWVVFAGQAFSLFGSRLVQFTLVWWLTQESGSASVLALASIMALLPQVIVGPFAGSLVDRWSRRILLIVSDGMIALAIVFLALLYSWGIVEIWHVYALMLFRALLGAFQWPAFQASTSLMVPKEQLSRVAGFNQSLQGLVSILAPPLGALLFDVLPIEYILAIDVATAFFAIGPLLFVTIPQPPRAPDAEGGWRSVLADMREGMRFVWDWKGLRFIMGMSMIINLVITPGFSLLPSVVTVHFGGGAIELAYLQSAGGIGMIAGGLLLGVWGGFKNRMTTAFSALAVGGLFIVLFGFVPGSMLLLAVAAFFLFSALNSMANGTFFAAMQAAIPPEMQGRVFTLLMSFSALMAPLGLAIAGPVADIIGAMTWFILGGATLTLMGVLGFFIPAIMNLEKDAPNAAPEE
ncbi:MAG: MFS transporter [Candidatus Bathyarchaeia archaeon]